MIKSRKHKGLRQFYETGTTSGIIAEHHKRLKVILQTLDAATKPEHMNLPGYSFHKLKGELKDYYSVSVRANWKIIFKFENEDVYLVDYLDYH